MHALQSKLPLQLLFLLEQKTPVQSPIPGFSDSTHCMCYRGSVWEHLGVTTKEQMGTAGVPVQISAGVLGERSRAATLFPALPAVNALVSNLTTTCVMWRDQNGSSSGKQGQLLWSRPILFISLLRGTPCFSSKHRLKPIYSSPVLPKTMKRFTIHLATQPGTYPCLQAPPTTP